MKFFSVLLFFSIALPAVGTSVTEEEIDSQTIAPFSKLGWWSNPGESNIRKTSASYKNIYQDKESHESGEVTCPFNAKECATQGSYYQDDDDKIWTHKVLNKITCYVLHSNLKTIIDITSAVISELFIAKFGRVIAGARTFAENVVDASTFLGGWITVTHRESSSGINQNDIFDKLNELPDSAGQIIDCKRKGVCKRSILSRRRKGSGKGKGHSNENNKDKNKDEDKNKSTTSKREDPKTTTTEDTKPTTSQSKSTTKKDDHKSTTTSPPKSTTRKDDHKATTTSHPKSTSQTHSSKSTSTNRSHSTSTKYSKSTSASHSTSTKHEATSTGTQEPSATPSNCSGKDGGECKVDCSTFDPWEPGTFESEESEEDEELAIRGTGFFGLERRANGVGNGKGILVCGVKVHTDPYPPGGKLAAVS
ncbi:hypothetical protein MaudCBS49596_004882 [Microsporum audouinii]